MQNESSNISIDETEKDIKRTEFFKYGLHDDFKTYETEYDESSHSNYTLDHQYDYRYTPTPFFFTSGSRCCAGIYESTPSPAVFRARNIKQYVCINDNYAVKKRYWDNMLNSIPEHETSPTKTEK